MSKYTFKPNQRYAVFKSFDGICQWCREPIDFKSFHVDHILPEELLNDPDRFNDLIKSFNLRNDFQINDYENWAPLHSWCNQVKSKKVYEGAPVILSLLDASGTRKKSAQMIEFRLDREPDKALIITQVQAAIERSLINIEELTNSILNQKFMDADDNELIEIKNVLDKREEYQTEIMLKDIVDILEGHTREISLDIGKQLGNPWRTDLLGTQGNDPEDGLRHFSCQIMNDADLKMSVRIVTIAHFDNKKFSIIFKDSTYNVAGVDLVGNFEQDLNKIDWTAIRAYIRSVYIKQLRKKANINI